MQVVFSSASGPGRRILKREILSQVAAVAHPADSDNRFWSFPEFFFFQNTQ
jgi:hypothetical protein